MNDATKDLKDQLLSFINTNFLLGTTAIEVRHDDSLMEKGIVDSTGVLELISFLQKSFSITINDEDLIPENLDTINNIVAFIQRKKSIAS